MPRTASSAPWRLLVIVMALVVLVPAATSDARPARAAHGSCTGWTSRYVPPETIRVGRADGTVETVDFRRYVGVVTAREWPAWMPLAAIEAGAVAVKQYGWWYTLANKHRSGYVNAQGECFDVRDGTVDQLYRPEKVTVGPKIWRAVDATLGLSVRKNGTFFMTGYRAGKSGVCASDADGWKLFAKSVLDCAERGWSREQIQTAYYAPGVTFHWAGAVPTPTGVDVPIDPPTVRLRTGTTLRQKHALVAWDQAGARPAGTFYQLQRLVSGRWSTVSLAEPTKPQLALSLKRGRTHRFRVRLRDTDGNAGAWHAGPRFHAGLVQDSSTRLTWSAGWRRVSAAAASGGTVTYAKLAGSAATLSFTGRAVAVIGTMGPRRGVARVFIDGELEAEVDLHASSSRWRVLVFARSWSDSVARSIRVEVVGTTGRPRVDVDGILVHR